jgi:Raf kinase inhibitor-like YbhB/YbcL family protein
MKNAMLLAAVAALSLAGPASAAGSVAQSLAELNAKEPSIKVKSAAIQQGKAVPVKHTADGDDMAPDLQWSDLPAKTESIAICVVDPDAPNGDWWHWILFNLPATASELKEGTSKSAVVDNGASQGTNDFGKSGYNGPSPPAGKTHRYFFNVYALDTTLKKSVDDKAAFVAALKGHVIARGELMATYLRK